jgi:hypothetical protein
MNQSSSTATRIAGISRVPFDYASSRQKISVLAYVGLPPMERDMRPFSKANVTT